MSSKDNYGRTNYSTLVPQRPLTKEPEAEPPIAESILPAPALDILGWRDAPNEMTSVGERKHAHDDEADDLTDSAPDPVRLSCNSAWLAGLTEGQPGTDFLQTVTETLSGKAIPDLGITTAISEAVSSIVDQQERAATTIKNAVSALGDYSVGKFSATSETAAPVPSLAGAIAAPPPQPASPSRAQAVEVPAVSTPAFTASKASPLNAEAPAQQGTVASAAFLSAALNVAASEATSTSGQRPAAGETAPAPGESVDPPTASSSSDVLKPRSKASKGSGTGPAPGETSTPDEAAAASPAPRVAAPPPMQPEEAAAANSDIHAAAARAKLEASAQEALLAAKTATEAAQRMKREAEEQAEKAAKAAAEAQTALQVAMAAATASED